MRPALPPVKRSPLESPSQVPGAVPEAKEPASGSFVTRRSASSALTRVVAADTTPEAAAAAASVSLQLANLAAVRENWESLAESGAAPSDPLQQAMSQPPLAPSQPARSAKSP